MAWDLSAWPQDRHEAHSKASNRTMHFVGQSTILTLTDRQATGEAYTLAHHLTIDGDKRSLLIAALRYADTFVKSDGAWLFAERRLYVDWLEQRAW